MENKEYLSEEKYQQTNAKVKKIGKILLIVGIVILVKIFQRGIFKIVAASSKLASIFLKIPPIRI